MFRHMRRVGWTDVDPSSNYQFTTVLRYVEEAEIAWFRSLGVLDLLYPHLPRTFVKADFRSPAHFDDVVSIDVQLARLGRSSIELDFWLRLDEALCASGTLGAAYLDADGRSAPLPGAARAALESHLVALRETR